MERRTLTYLFENGYSIDYAAAYLGRTPYAIACAVNLQFGINIYILNSEHYNDIFNYAQRPPTLKEYLEQQAHSPCVPKSLSPP